jgi:outer membrane receptor protein involved in Fe transport
MRKFGLLGTSALGSVTFIGLSIALAAPAYAQSDPPGTPCVEDESTTEADCPEALGQNEVELESGQAVAEDDSGTSIVVTGTRINRPNLTSTVPITSVGAQELTNTGNLSLGDRLNQLPQLRQTFSQANSTRFIGTAGINALDLRGLGNTRTLVLVNGRRIVTATPGVNRPDVNNIPTDLVDRVDIVTGGNSAIYGSDAVAGVVNFVLKRNFDGIRVRGQGGISSRGDRGSYFASLTAGHNFGDDRGNVAVALEWAKTNTLFNSFRERQTGSTSGRSQFNATENVGANLNPNAGPLRPAEGSTGNGIPDTTFLRNVLNNNISVGGLLTASCPIAAAAGESAAAFAARRAATCTGLANFANANPLNEFGRTFVFTPDGSLIRNPCITDLRPFGSSNCVGGLGSSLRESGMLAPGLERKSATLLAHFELAEAFVPFINAQFVRVDANQEGQPTFFNNTFSINNPFLTPQAQATLATLLAPGTTTFAAQRFNIDFGGRGELHKRENYQVVVGANGTFNDDWRYEVSFNYGRLWTYYETKGNILRAQYARSINAVRNSAGNIVCAVNADVPTANDDPACVPVNLFGDGQVSQAALDYFGVTSSRVQRANLYDATAFVSGDFSQLFELPGGPIGFVLGAEYRRETAFAAYDPVTSDPAGLTFLNVIPDFVPPAMVVKDAFAEISFPLLRDMPFAHELTIDAAGRFSDYNIGSTGTVFAYNVNGTWAPVSDIRFRAGYARSIRAPSQGDLFSPLSQTFLNGLIDPCGQQNINNNPNRVANCAAAGVPTTQTFTVGGVTSTEPFSNRPASGISGFNGANPNLREERGTSLTIGTVIQPRFIPGLSVTIDYYDIKIDNVIFSLAAQTIINQCYDAPGGINNQFCAAIFRNPNGTFAGQSNVNHGGGTADLTPTGPSFISGPFNFAKQETSGIDFDAAYRTTIAGDFKVNLRGILSYVFEKNNYTDINDPLFYDRQLSELGDPQWQGQFSANVDKGIYGFGYRFRYIGKQVIALQYETQNSVQGRPPTNPDALPRIWYPEVMYHDARFEIRPADRFKFYVGVDNFLDRLPPFDLQGNEGGNPFDVVGRFFYAGAEIKF